MTSFNYKAIPFSFETLDIF